MKENEWFKSSFSGEASCVEVMKGSNSGSVYVRNSKRPHDATAQFTTEEWTSFTEGVRAGEFD